jgi:hypothetical protein
VMEWSSVQEERPRASTSGGQSEGRTGAAAAAAGLDLEVAFDMANREDTLEHVRHLENNVSRAITSGGIDIRLWKISAHVYDVVLTVYHRGLAPRPWAGPLVAQSQSVVLHRSVRPGPAPSCLQYHVKRQGKKPNAK